MVAYYYYDSTILWMRLLTLAKAQAIQCAALHHAAANSFSLITILCRISCFYLHLLSMAYFAFKKTSCGSLVLSLFKLLDSPREEEWRRERITAQCAPASWKYCACVT